MKIHDILSEMQRNLIVPKEHYNSHLRYKYRNAEDIVGAVTKIIPNGVFLTLSDDIVLIGSRFYIKATAQLSSETGSISVTGYAREAETKSGNDVAQVTGAASSYARKYALNGLFALDDGVDDDKLTDIAPKNVAPKPDLAEKRRKAEVYVNEYLTSLTACPADELEGFTMKHADSLRRIHDGYPDLSDAINLAMKNKRKEI